jgi:cell division GTPase FtsZ
VQGISDLITVHGLINLDFADVKSVMKNAGSALMGIGRASGENRAVQAAQQAIDSPLLEVSIDGARGILFNVIGGNDLSMHEINAAAEAITAAADPDANIIFGATISPEVEGEIIITVVATGFDASYFAKRQAANVADIVPAAPAVVTSNPMTAASEQDMSDIDMELKEQTESAAADFRNDDPVPNIWSIADSDTDDTAADNDPDRPAIVSSHEEDELERPSFLRRLTKRGHKDDSDKKDGE